MALRVSRVGAVSCLSPLLPATLSRVVTNPGSGWLVASGSLSLAASLLHIGCIIGGSDWYRFFGAGEAMARAAERGSWMPALLTLIIAAILAVWAAFALSAAGKFIRLPLARTALVAISAVLMLRAVLRFNPLFLPIPSLAFKLWSSAICLIFGLCFAVGTRRAWSALSWTQPILFSK
jgi:hypothetical protein